MSKEQYKETMKGLGARLKTEKVEPPIQEVRPVEPDPQPAPKLTTEGQKRKESHVNFWVPDELMVRLKVHAAKSGKTVKQIGIEALEQYLPKE